MRATSDALLPCPFCRGALPGGCSTCKPQTFTVGRITLEGGATTHTCPQCMRGLPCAPEVNRSSLSSLVGLAASRHVPTDAQWKRGQFGDGAIQ